jgi:ribonuclease HI
MDRLPIIIHTDGGCSGNPGPGGWAYAITRDGLSDKHGLPVIIAEKWGGEKNTTNNRMELLAVICALEALPTLGMAPNEICIKTDSQYVQMGMNQWIHLWKLNEWRTSDRHPVKNRDLWERLDVLSSSRTIRWKWIRGHAGSILNEHCDHMTQKAIATVYASELPPRQHILHFSDE